MSWKDSFSFKSKHILTAVKYGLAAAIAIIAFVHTQAPAYLIGSLFELSIIFFLSDMLIRKWPRIGYVINSLAFLLFNVQQLLLNFGSTYLTMIMLTNLDSVQDLGGRAAEYIIAGITVLLLSFLPIRPVNIRHVSPHNGLIAVLIADLLFCMTFAGAYSPLYDYIDVAAQAKQQADREAYIASQPNMTDKFYQPEINMGTAKPESLPENPNIILIMTEGLSQSIVEDEREIMPNVQKYENRSLNFTNYFNHTAATYRGIIGQLYSGYQNNNLDSNNLISIEEILKERGYYTSFVNTEENNLQFTEYLRSLGFDDVLGKDPDNWLTDKKAYEFLWDTVEKQGDSDQPFFTCIYTFNTHLTYDSTDKKFGDGTNAELNKFYNCDYQFGKFMRRFRTSDLADNTIIVFTADHCTYVDDAFTATFPDAPRTYSFCDRIPFFIYYRGITPQEVDADGRNSLCLVPTILDYIDASAPNYFLGTSLFLSINNDASPYDTVYTEDNSLRISTSGAAIQGLDPALDTEMESNINDYFAAAQQERK